MFRVLFKKILSWLREIWSLFKIIDDATPKHQYNRTPVFNTPQSQSQAPAFQPQNTPRKNVLQSWNEDEPSVIRYRYIELDGYEESLRIDERGHYDLNQLARFAENFVWIGPNDVTDFIADSIEHDIEFIDGTRAIWVAKDDCIEWAFLQYSALADLL